MDGWHLTAGVARWVRGSVVGLLTVLLGTAAHVAAGGHAPPATAAVGIAALVGALAVALSGRRWSTSPLLGMFLLAQTGIHLAAMSAGPHGSMADPLMLGTHALAALILVLTVLQGERALLAVLDHLVLRRPPHRPAVPAVRDTHGTTPSDSPRPLRLPVDLRGRAPPVPA